MKSEYPNDDLKIEWKPSANTLTDTLSTLLQDISRLQKNVDLTESTRRKSWWGDGPATIDTVDNKTLEISTIRDKIADIIDYIHDRPEFMDFVEKIDRQYGDISKRLRPSVAFTASERFARFLEKRDFPLSEAQNLQKLHQEFIQDELPELEVLAAVQDMREQYEVAKSPPVALKKPYPGRRSKDGDADPLEFLKEVYGEDIEAGRLSSGRLKEIDPLLHHSLYLDLRARGETVSSVVEPRGRATTRRSEALAVLLGINSVDEAARFFGTHPARGAKRSFDQER